MLHVRYMAHFPMHTQAVSWRVPEKALSLVMVALASLSAPRKRAMPRVTRPTQTIDLGMQPTDVSMWAGDNRPL